MTVLEKQAPPDVLRLARRRSARRALSIVVAALAVFSAYAVIADGATLYLQRLVDGTSNGVLYGLVALSLVLVYKATRVINFAQGAMAMAGTFLAYTAWNSWGLPLVVAILLAMLVSAVGAAGVERVLVRPFDPANHLAITIVTLALYLIFNAGAAMIWGFDPRGFPSLFPTGSGSHVEVLGARLSYVELGTLLLAVVLVLALHLVLTRTRMGLRFRAVASSLDSARLVGVHIGATVQGAWALAAAVGTLAGCLVAPTTFLDPTFMDKVLVYSFAAATLGGLDSVVGALVGGAVVGLTVTLVTGYVPAVGGSFGLACAFVVIIAVLQFKPTGLLGARGSERV
ncbi:branched-chain amino acid ABC transporter permease [Cryptosporangium sp. NPDC048952]|uniref:branched-chain amino acid ABC transporter permease n=1 Tax=Cryptosporangium sp. NPDC048952 TaxID=3363961 RepID=UPI00371A398E